MPKILVVDDDPHIRSVLRFALERDGFAIAEAADGAAALAAIARENPDLVVLDVVMPEMDGTEVCRRLRRDSSVPVIFLSSRDEELDRILGLELGGDDYVVKPFSPREVVARVRAVLRRPRLEPEAAASAMQRGKLTLHPDRFEALWDGAALALTVTEFAILRALAATPGRVLTRDALMDVAYPDRRVVADRTIDSHVRHLRAKLASVGGDPIGTVHGLGYRFVGVSPPSLWPSGVRKPRIRTVLLAASLLILAAPLAGLWLLRIYESALVRQTETELIGQAAVIAAAYRVAWAGPDAPPPAPGPEGQWMPRPATLDLARDPVLPAPAEAQLRQPAEPRALAAGAALQPVLAEAQRVTLAAMRVLDRAGVVVASSREELGLSLATQEEVARALAGEPAAALRARFVAADQPRGAGSISRGTAIRVFVAQPVLEEGRVIGAVLLSRTPPDIVQTLAGKRWELGVMTLALLLTAGGLALFTSATVSRPIQAVTAQARAVAAGGVLPERVRGSAVREADELSAAIRAMAETLRRRADYIEAFATEVSHEFKTPLAALRGALELLQDHAATMTEAERARFLAQCVEDVERLDRLVRRLLELARAEAPPARDAACELGAVVQESVAPFRAAGLAVEVVGAASVIVALPAETLRAVLRNLLENTRQHAGHDASCRIAWRAEEGVALLRFSDDGRGISAGNAPRIFDRFFTTARESGGTGLGLSLVRRSLEAAGGRIELLDARPGAAFVLTLPLAANPRPPT